MMGNIVSSVPTKINVKSMVLVWIGSRFPDADAQITYPKSSDQDIDIKLNSCPDA